MTDQKIFDKIKKLLALGSSPNPHEASSAMAMAQKLMAEHGVSQVDVGVSQIDHVEVKSPFSISQPKNYEVILAKRVADAFGCRVMWQANRSFAVDRDGKRDDLGKFVFYGAKSQLPVCEHFFVLLQRRLLSGRAEFVRGLRGTASRKEMTKEGDGWCVGYVMAIDGALMSVASDVPSETLDAYRDKRLRVDGEAKAQNRRTGSMGFAAGDAAGRAEKLHRPMTAASAARIGG